METQRQVTTADLAEILVAVRHMGDAMVNLSAKWEDYARKTGDSALEGEGEFGKYPFSHEFSEQVHMVLEWANALTQRHDIMRLAEFDKWKAV